MVEDDVKKAPADESFAALDPETLEPVLIAANGSIVAIAARVGTTRLIDNVILGAPDTRS